MNPAPGLAMWLEFVLALGAGTAALIVLTALLGRLTRSARWRQALWQTTTLGLAVLLLSELSGITAGASDWISQSGTVKEENVVALQEGPQPQAGAPTADSDPQKHGRRGSPASPARPSPSLPAKQPLNATVTQTVEAREPRLPYTTARGEKSIEPLPARSEPTISAATSTENVLKSAETSEAAWWPGLIWLLGTMMVASRVVVARLLLMFFRRRHLAPRCERADDISARVKSIADRLGIRRHVCLIEAPGLLGPVAFGTLRPTIALPAKFGEELSPSKQEAVLAHELAHLAGHDPAWHLLADLVAAGLWWHPLAWWSRRQLRMASEWVADEASLVVAEGPSELAACLVELGTRLTKPRPAGWMGVEGGGFRSNLGRRVERLIKLSGQTWRPPSRTRIALTISVGSVALIATAIFCTAWARSQALSQEEQSMKTMQQAWKRSLAGMMLAAALSSGSDRAHAHELPKQALDKPATARKADHENTKEEKPEQDVVVRVFRINHFDSEELRNVAMGLLFNRSRVLSTGQHALQVRIDGSPFGGPVLHVAVDKRTSTLLVRGFQQDVETMAELIAVLDVSPGQPTPKVNHLQVFRLRFADAVKLHTVIKQLFSEARIATSPKSNSLIMLKPKAAIVEQPKSIWGDLLDESSRKYVRRELEGELQTITDLVTMLDVSPESAPPQLKNIQSLKLRFADPKSVSEMVKKLDLSARIAAEPSSNSLIILGSEEAIKQVRQVVQALDVEGKTPPEQPKQPAGTAPAVEKPRGAGSTPVVRGQASTNRTDAAKKEKEQLYSKVFRLKHVNPEAVKAILAGDPEYESPQEELPAGIVVPETMSQEETPRQGLLERSSVEPKPAEGAGQTGKLSYFQSAQPRPGSGGGFGGRGFQGGFGGGGIGGFGGGGFASVPPRWRLNVDKRSRALIVRGAVKDLRITEDLIAVLDLPAGKPIPKVDSLRAFKLKFADAGEVYEVLVPLDIGVRIAALETEGLRAPPASPTTDDKPKQEDPPRRRADLLIIAGSDEAMQEAAELIEALDVETKEPKKE